MSAPASARPHLRLLVSEAPLPDLEPEERLSLVQPVNGWRLRRRWLRFHAATLTLWSASALLLLTAALFALGIW